MVTERCVTAIVNHTLTHSLEPSEGFWGPHNILKIFIKRFKCLIVQLSHYCHTFQILHFQPTGTADDRTQP